MKKIVLLAVFLLSCSSADRVTAEEVEYKGVKKCKTCHIKVYKTWLETKHATAFDRLNDAEKKNLPGVQCEACHGAGGAFSSAKIMNKKKFAADPEKQKKMAVEAGLVVAPSESNCKQCHNEKSPHYEGFDFKARYEEIKHTNK
jgi:hypothetical protein